ncbi:MAG: hypothetical protein HPY76_14730 [Anaerolineae bacterium]|nr:hypothetical protein [Anaerolineae bacterium]
MKKKLTQAYKQAPWRIQTQWIGLILIILVGFVLIAGLYLKLTADITVAGINVRKLKAEEETIRRSIASQQSQYALLTASSSMEERALALGYRLQNPDETIYLMVPGYAGKQSALVGVVVDTILPAQVIKPVYTQSLWEWFYQNMIQSRDVGLEALQ